MAQRKSKRGRPPASGVVTYIRLPAEVRRAAEKHARAEQRTLSGEIERLCRAAYVMPVSP